MTNHPNRSKRPKWQDISTAPWDGSFIVANALGEVCACTSTQGSRLVHNSPRAQWSFGNTATHWMPLPEPPADHPT